MYKILYTIIGIILFSCKSISTAQEKKATPIQTPNSKIEKQITPGPNNLGPNSIQLTAEIYEVSKDFKVCDRNYKVAILVKIKIVSNGFGIVNPLSTGQEITLGVHKSLLKKLDVDPNQLKTRQHVTVIVRERLCLDASVPTYEITSFLPR